MRPTFSSPPYPHIQRRKAKTYSLNADIDSEQFTLQPTLMKHGPERKPIYLQPPKTTTQTTQGQGNLRKPNLLNDITLSGAEDAHGFPLDTPHLHHLSTSGLTGRELSHIHTHTLYHRDKRTTNEWEITQTRREKKFPKKKFTLYRDVRAGWTITNNNISYSLFNQNNVIRYKRDNTHTCI